MSAFGFLAAAGRVVMGAAEAVTKPLLTIRSFRSRMNSQTEPILDRNQGVDDEEEDPILQPDPVDEDLTHHPNQEPAAPNDPPLAFDIEQGLEAPVDAGAAAGDDDFRKIASGVGSGLVSVSLALIITPVQHNPSHFIVVACYNASVHLSFFAGCGILVHSFVKKTVSDDVRRLQKIVMPVAVVFLCVAFVLRTYAVSSARSFWLGLVIFVIVGLLLGLLLYVYLLLARKGRPN